MKGMASGLALWALAGLACAPAHAAEGRRGDTALADPAPVPGTLDYQYAALEKAPKPAVVAAAAPAQAGSVNIAHRVIDAAGAFDGYTRRAGALGSGYKDAAFVRKAVDAGAGYEATQLQAGAIAYGALVALQDPMFVDAVNAAAPTASARERMASDILNDPAAVLRLEGAHETAQRVSQLVGRRGQALVAAGDSVNVASHTVQKEAWSKVAISHPDEQLRAIKAQSAAHTTLAAADADALFTDLVALRKSPQSYGSAGRPTRAVAQSLAVAALAVLGHGDEAHAADLEPLLSTGQGADCLKLAKLNLYQCLAVVGPQYEDMFCLGRHGLGDTGQCVASTAGYVAPIAPEPVLVQAVQPVEPPPSVAPTLVAASLSVPVADSANDGPERTRAFAEAAPPVPEPIAAEPPPVQMARADLPAYADVPRVERAADADEEAADRMPAPRYADAGYAPRRRRWAESAYDPRDMDDDAPPAAPQHRYTWDPADGPPPAAPAGWRRAPYGSPYGDDDR